jgi:hypothetical protein
MNAAFIIREAGEPPRTYKTVHAVARALLLCSGPSQPVTVRLADQRERQLSPVELDRIRRAIPEAREALAVEAEGDADVENDRLAAELGLA